MGTMAKRPRDPNQLGKLMVDIMTGEVEDTISSEKKNATRKGRAGGLKGGQARAVTLPGPRRSEIARKAAQTRWKRDASNEKP